MKEKYKEEIGKNPNNFVLKPQREGGGNNIFGEEILKFLASFNSHNLDEFILMKFIKSIQHSSIFVWNENEYKVEENCITEIGFYGYCLYDKEMKTFVLDGLAGELARTKQSIQKEGGVVSGHSALNSLCPI
ncbi:hypothetical protein SNEBB_010163 [Seison nebaliae]|nr:hypothetical protein SNEBB_010163 [Seison nebaliae]